MPRRGLNSARLYGIKHTNGQVTNESGDQCGDDAHGAYHPVPVNYASLIPIALKRTMEFPGFALNDTLSKLRREYLAMGGQPSNMRHGWVRTRV